MQNGCLKRVLKLVPWQQPSWMTHTMTSSLLTTRTMRVRPVSIHFHYYFKDNKGYYSHAIVISNSGRRFLSSGGH